MRGRAVLWLSLALNLALAGWLLISHRQATPPAARLGPEPLAGLSTSQIRTNVLVRRQFFSWNQLESEDYPTYIANLRAVGCPEPTIRDIIVTDVNQLFARRRATEILTPQQQWWRSTPDPAVTQTALTQLRALEDERRALLTRLLGPDWDSADYPYASSLANSPLDGPILGTLSPQAKAAVQAIERASADRQEAYLEEQLRAGRDPDPAMLARLRQQTRDELARVLTPEQLEEFLLRYANNAVQLRSTLRGIDTSPEEFRQLFRSLDQMDSQLQAVSGATDPAAARDRDRLQQQREDTLRLVLGTDRYQEYRLNQDPVYLEARTVAEQSGAPPDKLVPLAAIYRLTNLEEQRIRNDPDLSAEERAERLRATRDAQADSLRRLLGDAAYQRYVEATSR